MSLLRRPGGILEFRTAQFRCRLQPLCKEEGYRVTLFHYKPNGFADSRLIFRVKDPREINVVLAVLQEVQKGALAAEAARDELVS